MGPRPPVVDAEDVEDVRSRGEVGVVGLARGSFQGRFQGDILGGGGGGSISTICSDVGCIGEIVSGDELGNGGRSIAGDEFICGEESISRGDSLGDLGSAGRSIYDVVVSSRI